VVDDFGLLVFGGLVALVLVFLAIGKWYPGSGAEQVHWRPTRSVELEAQLEVDDLEQMIEAQNERRRASGREEISEESMRADVEQAERWRREQAQRYRGAPPDDDA
jgi:hypothetical protein